MLAIRRIGRRESKEIPGFSTDGIRVILDLAWRSLDAAGLTG